MRKWREGFFFSFIFLLCVDQIALLSTAMKVNAYRSQREVQHMMEKVLLWVIWFFRLRNVPEILQIGLCLTLQYLPSFISFGRKQAWLNSMGNGWVGSSVNNWVSGYRSHCTRSLLLHRNSKKISIKKSDLSSNRLVMKWLKVMLIWIPAMLCAGSYPGLDCWQSAQPLALPRAPISEISHGGWKCITLRQNSLTTCDY